MRTSGPRVGAPVTARRRRAGECGLDYDRTHFCAPEVQRRHFRRHFELAQQHGLPMFLHNRNTAGDFAAIVREHGGAWLRGVAHSFTGPAEELRELLDLGLYIGINGCSLKSEENLAVLRELPLDRLMLETGEASLAWSPCGALCSPAPRAQTRLGARSARRTRPSRT